MTALSSASKAMAAAFCSKFHCGVEGFCFGNLMVVGIFGVQIVEFRKDFLLGVLREIEFDCFCNLG